MEERIGLFWFTVTGSSLSLFGKSRQQKHEAAGHMQSMCKKQRKMNFSAQPTFSISYSPESQPKLKEGLSISTNLIKISLTDTWSVVSRVIPESVKLTMLTSTSINTSI